MRRALYLLFSLAVLAADQISKAAVSRHLPEGRILELAPWFWLVHWRNTGGVWGTFQDLPHALRTGLFILLPALGLAVLLWLFLKARTAVDRALLACIFGAALGNLADRLRLGAVVDYLYFRWPGGPGWPAFNVADAVLSCGLLFLLYRTFTSPADEGHHAPDPLPHR
jgi:signal peptidase II